MTTAIASYNSDGCVGRCDARCHNATSATCDCICGGRLHGVGADNAIAQNTRDLLGDDYVAELEAATGLRLEFPADVVQLELA